MDIRKFDVAMRDYWKRTYNGGECLGDCQDDDENFDEEVIDFASGRREWIYVGPEAEFHNVRTGAQLCGDCFRIVVDNTYRIIEEVPIP